MSRAKPTHSGPAPDEKRQALLEQLSYLLLELDAIEPLLDRIPAEALAARPLNKWSILEIFGHLADCDLHVFLPRFRSMVESEIPKFENVDQDALVRDHRWNDLDIADIIQALRISRKEVVSLLETFAGKDWTRQGVFPDGETRDVFGLALYITQHDAHHLRAVANLIHESHINP